MSIVTGSFRRTKDVELIFEESYRYEKGFSEFYKENIIPIVDEYEKKRIGALEDIRKRLKFTALVYTLLIIAKILMNNYVITHPEFSQTDIYQFSNLIILGVVILMYIYNVFPAYKYKSNIKQEVFPKMISFFGENFRYSPNTTGEVRNYKEFPILPYYDIEESEDVFTGRYKDVDIHMFETKLSKLREYTTKTSGGAKIRKKKKVQVFKGLFIAFNMNKNFKGKTIILKESGRIGNWLGHIARKLNNKAGYRRLKLENVKLEDVEFEKAFEIYSSDQIEARYLLTTAFMDRLLKTYKYFNKRPLQACFTNQTLLITIPFNKNLFEPGSIFDRETFIDDAKKLIREMSIIFRIIDTLKLDQNIGM